jgi:hypothetical protein
MDFKGKGLIMKNLTIFVVFLALGCGDNVRGFQADDTDSGTDTGSEDAGLDTDTDSETETAGPVDVDTDSDTDTGSEDAGLDTDTDTVTDTGAALCPWECKDGDVDDPLTVCDSNTATPAIVHNYNFECTEKNYWCCQPLSADEPGSIHEACASQGEGFSCQAPYNCPGTINTNFYCGAALTVCCEV